MTLTELIKAHDASKDTAVLYRQILDFKWPDGLHYWAVSDAIFNDDLNAAWRLLPEGWRWGDFVTVHGHKTRRAYAHIKKPSGYVSEEHKSLPCAMVLAALQAWEIE